MQSRRSVLQTILSAGIAAPAILEGQPAAAAQAKSLKAAFKHDFLIGAAINAAQFTGLDARGDALIAAQFNAVAPEDCLKWEHVHPRPDEYDFTLPDAYVLYGEKRDMFIVGHVLVWHEQTPDWVFRDAKGDLLDRDSLLARMRDHIHTVVGRYKGRVQSWDVVNDPVAYDGSLRPSHWYKIIGEDYIAKAFEYAHEADPDALRVYNDFDVEGDAKRGGNDAQIKKLKAAGSPITSVGLQGHYQLDTPDLDQLDATIAKYGEMGLKVPMTELDVTVLPAAQHMSDAESARALAENPALNPYAAGLPDEMQEKLAKHYADLFRIFRKNKGVVDRVSFWGVSDGDSWKNNWPIKGRTDYPLLFDRDGKPKPAYHAVIKTAKG